MKSTVKRYLVGALGFLVVAVGIVLMPLPGPGVLIVLAGVVILATQFEWAERRVDQVKDAALRGAADSVKSWPRIVMSVIGVIWLIGFGILWGLHPASPSWWPIDDKWWLYGGWGPGATLILSGVAAAAVLVYSYRNFREIKQEQAQAHNAAVD
ncbi:PGPGW domain-containing protein [Marmoricola sp. URHB0036]|uniref:PGPGW domain-containing protein n=1 Tax=Marmoricola sp. URHB0036 TaxID=1298863 RepID=UPI000408771F|nr:PGPGW domain-containing protein [Marmoricola sp. URHB0036]